MTSLFLIVIALSQFADSKAKYLKKGYPHYNERKRLAYASFKTVGFSLQRLCTKAS